MLRSRTLVLLSYDVHEAALLDLVTSVELVDQADWVAAGGVVR